VGGHPIAPEPLMWSRSRRAAGSAMAAPDPARSEPVTGVAPSGGRLLRSTEIQARPAPLFPSVSALRFHETLQRAPTDPARPLPGHFEPLVRAIAGSRPVATRTGPGTRAALAAAGKEAATVGGVIHLRRALDRSARSAEIVAHELVHAARPSARPRFFADDHHGPEEALAEHTGRLARALVAPQVATPPVRRAADKLAWGTQGLAVGALGGALQALSNDAATRPPAARVVARQALPATKASLVERTADLFRQPAVSPSVADYPRPGDGPIVRRSSWEPAPSVQREYAPSPTSSSNATTAETEEAAAPAPISGAVFDALVEALEQRVIDELERRGLRHHPGVF